MKRSFACQQAHPGPRFAVGSLVRWALLQEEVSACPTATRPCAASPAQGELFFLLCSALVPCLHSGGPAWLYGKVTRWHFHFQFVQKWLLEEGLAWALVFLEHLEPSPSCQHHPVQYCYKQIVDKNHHFLHHSLHVLAHILSFLALVEAPFFLKELNREFRQNKHSFLRRVVWLNEPTNKYLYSIGKAWLLLIEAISWSTHF